MQKRISVVRGRRPLAGSHPDEFFENFLRDGTGGTCWPSSGALHALLVALGFDARRIAGRMDPQRYPDRVNHGSVIVRVGDGELLVDSSMLTERPLPLRRDRETALEDPVHLIRATPSGALWRIEWRLQGSDREIQCDLVEDDVPLERYLERYEDSRVNGFSYVLTLTKNTPSGVLSLNGMKRTFRDRAGRLAGGQIADRDRCLTEEVGLSRDIVAELPADEEDPTRPAVTA